MVRRSIAATGAVALLAVTLGACGTTQPSKTVTVVRTTTSIAEPAGDASSAPRNAATARAASAALRPCDAHVSAKVGTTTCEFAENVFYEFWNAVQQGDDAVTAYSPVSKRVYAMSCTAGTTVACRGGDGSEVRFPMSAVRAYDTAQADAYRCTHDTSADPDRSGCSGDAGGGDSGASGGVSADECDPGYEGACLDPNASDYDCQGGSGDGPEYTGRVQVVGDDHYGLDRDGNGVGCE